jgi:hypothetical protein
MEQTEGQKKRPPQREGGDEPRWSFVREIMRQIIASCLSCRGIDYQGKSIKFISTNTYIDNILSLNCFHTLKSIC